MNVGSLFSGIGGIDLGLERAGMRVLWQCEADPYRRAVLRAHWPDVPCYEDVRAVACEERNGRRRPLGRAQLHADAGCGGAERSPGAHIDLLCGGFPCQDLSVAGRRAGLGGARSSLFFEFARVAELVRPRWLLIENVPGLLSSNGGRDFAVVYATLAELGYGLAWRVLDSRHFGVPQRRRRVFIVGHLGADSAAPFLPFLEGGQGDPAAGGEAGQGVVAYAIAGKPWRSSRVAGILGGLTGGCRATDLDGNGAYVVNRPGVRRLTPTECCRLQGFPDDWLGPPNQPPDRPRYAALGDAVTVPVAEWIGRRILEADRNLRSVAA